MRFRYGLISIFAAVIALAGSAFAQTQITLATSQGAQYGAQGKVTFLQNGNIQLGSCSGGTCTFSGRAYFEDSPTSFTYTITTNAALSYDADGNISGPTNTLFTFGQTGGPAWFTANIKWTYAVLSQTPQLNGELKGLSVNPAVASEDFAAAFAGHYTGEFGLTLTCLGKKCIQPGKDVVGYASSGSAIPAPEPASLGLLGSGLLLAGSAARRRWKK